MHTRLPFLLALLLFLSSPLAAQEGRGYRGEHFYGNIYGTVVSHRDGSPVAGALIYATPPEAAASNLSPAATAVGRAHSDPQGNFLISGLPVAGDAQTYAVIIFHRQFDTVMVQRARVLPGAAMALNITVRLTTTGSPLVMRDNHPTDQVTLRYRHQMVARKSSLPAQPSTNLSRAPSGIAATTVFATREGLVGGTTANGHLIRPRDHFVALPYREVLCSLGGNEFQVALSHEGRTVTAPVWDIGPWNIHDNYWAEEADREIYDYLENGGHVGGLDRGLPASQAAYEDGFNSGRDEKGRTVLNPAAIDLADGTFWDDMGLIDNAWIEVRFLWMDGDELSPPDGNGNDSSNTGCFIQTVTGGE